MIGGEAHFDEFIDAHRWAVITTLRSDGSASNSVVAYARDGDTLVVSTPGHTLKRRTLETDPRVTLTIISNHEPFNFVSVEGHAVVQTQNLSEPTRRVFENIESVGYTMPEDLDAWLAKDDRVILRITPLRVSGVIRA